MAAVQVLEEDAAAAAAAALDGVNLVMNTGFVIGNLM